MRSRLTLSAQTNATVSSKAIGNNPICPLFRLERTSSAIPTWRIVVLRFPRMRMQGMLTWFSPLPFSSCARQVAWAGIPTAPAWLPATMLEKSDKLDYIRM